MTGTPRRPWTPERDKELRELVFSASSAETYWQGSKPDHFCGTSQSKYTEASIEKDCQKSQVI
jgi:hypothetical protein